MASTINRSAAISPIPPALMQRFGSPDLSADPATIRLQSMINNPVASDVLFLVGPKRTAVHAHSTILTNASGFFYDMFVCDGITVDGYPPIEVEQFTTEEWIEFLWFVYCKQCSIDDSNAYYMAKAAVLYGVTDLFPHILKWMMERGPEEYPLLDIFFERQMTLPEELNVAFTKLFHYDPLEFTTCRNLNDSDTFQNNYNELLQAVQEWTQLQLDIELADSDRTESTEESSTEGAMLRTDPFFSGQFIAQRPCVVFGVKLHVGATRGELGASELTAVVRVGNKRDPGVYERVTIPVLDEVYEYEYMFQSISVVAGEELELCVAIDGPDNGRTVQWSSPFQIFTGDETLELNEFYLGDLISPLVNVLYTYEEVLMYYGRDYC